MELNGGQGRHQGTKVWKERNGGRRENGGRERNGGREGNGGDALQLRFGHCHPEGRSHGDREWREGSESFQVLYSELVTDQMARFGTVWRISHCSDILTVILVIGPPMRKWGATCYYLVLVSMITSVGRVVTRRACVV